MEKIEELAQTITDLAESNPEQCVLLLEAIARKRQDIPDAHQAHGPNPSSKNSKLTDTVLTVIKAIMRRHCTEAAESIVEVIRQHMPIEVE